MLGISFQNEIIADRKVTDPADILNDLRSEVVKALSQTGRDDEQKDGLDIALIVYEPATGRLEFAGAYNPLYVVSDGELVEYKGDRMPISYSDDMERSFSKTGIQLKTGDVLYMFSDGFADQFGGPGRKKFKYKPLKELLVRIHHEPMDRQQLLLYETFFDWKGDIEQIDDVVLVGIRI
jgi:serine phosphatase RsbU (regulator of sigma subunit)